MIGIHVLLVKPPHVGVDRGGGPVRSWLAIPIIVVADGEDGRRIPARDQFRDIAFLLGEGGPLRRRPVIADHGERRQQLAPLQRLHPDHGGDAAPARDRSVPPPRPRPKSAHVLPLQCVRNASEHEIHICLTNSLTHRAHLPSQQVDRPGQLVPAGAPREAADPRDSRVCRVWKGTPPGDSPSASTSAIRTSTSTARVRDLQIQDGSPCRPGRRRRDRAGPRVEPDRRRDPQQGRDLARPGCRRSRDSHHRRIVLCHESPCSERLSDLNQVLALTQ